MERIASTRGAVAVLLAFAAMLGAASGARAQDDFVRAPGGPFLTDAQGRRLELHGVNLVAKCGSDTVASAATGSPCLPGGAGGQPGYVLTPNAADPGRRFSAADAATLHGLGFSVVRLGLIWAGLEPGPPGARADDPTLCAPHLAGTPFPALGAADPYSQPALDAYLARVDTIVALLSRAHIRVLLDMHQDGWGRPFANPSSATPWMAEGAPAWATCTSGAPFTAPAAWQGAYTDPAVNGALQHFWANDVAVNLQGHYARVWTAVARHYAANADVIGYEIFNEPSGPVAPGAPAFDRQLQCFYAGTQYAPLSCASAAGPAQAPAQGLVPALLGADTHHLVFYEAPVLTDYGFPETVGIAEPLPFARLVLSFHDYGGTPGAGGFACTQPTCAPQEQNSLALFASERAATRTAQAGGPAWLLSEYGAEPYAPDVANVARLADTHLLSWTYWSALQLHDPTGGPGEGLLSDTTHRPDPARAQVLARTYPLATAGTPLAQSFTPTSGLFQFTYQADPAVHAATEILVPSLHYPHGYRVSAHGARVSSAANAPLLTLVNQPGAGTVTVTIRARAAAPPRPANPHRAHGPGPQAHRPQAHRPQPQRPPRTAPRFTG